MYRFWVLERSVECIGFGDLRVEAFRNQVPKSTIRSPFAKPRSPKCYISGPKPTAGSQGGSGEIHVSFNPKLYIPSTTPKGAENMFAGDCGGTCGNRRERDP